MTDETQQFDPSGDPDQTLDHQDRDEAVERSTEELVHKEVGDYEIESEIARGGMGVVYRARDKRLNRSVALKMILRGQFASDEDVRRFQQEAAAAAKLDHSGIVPIYGVGEHQGHHYFSMKLIEGGSLANQLPELREDIRATIQLLVKVCRAVHHAHQRGVLHRENLKQLVTTDNRAGFFRNARRSIGRRFGEVCRRIELHGSRTGIELCVNLSLEFFVARTLFGHKSGAFGFRDRKSPLDDFVDAIGHRAILMSATKGRARLPPSRM